MLKSKSLSITVLMAFFLCIFMGLGIQPGWAATNPSDISGHWASTSINNLNSQGIIAGYEDGTFKPDNSITRAEFIVMINRAFNYNTPDSMYYSDVQTSDWFYLDIAKAKGAGYISGYPDGTMQPNNKITRQEGAVILAQVLDLDLKTYGTASPIFSDLAEIPYWAWASISALGQDGYMNGYPDGTFRPVNNITRAEAATIIDQGRNRVPVTSVRLNQTSLILGLDTTETLIAEVSPGNATNAMTTWLSSDPLIALVDNTGQVTGLSEGKATITVTTADGNRQAFCEVTVADKVRVTGVTLDKSTLSLEDGDIYTLQATVIPDYAANPKITWSSNKTSVATVSSSGVVTARDLGAATITAKTEDGAFTAACEVTVNKKRGNNLSLNEEKITIDEGESQDVRVFLPAGYYGQDIEYIDYSSNDSSDVIADISYEDDYDDEDEYITFTIEAEDDVEGEATIYIKMIIDGEWYNLTMYVDVND